MDQEAGKDLGARPSYPFRGMDHDPAGDSQLSMDLGVVYINSHLIIGSWLP